MDVVSRSLVAGRGINDSNYTTQAKTGGRVQFCSYFTAWCRIMRSNAPVDPAWLRFSQFSAWMQKQDWEGKQIDRHLFGEGNLYGPDTCCYLSKEVANAVRALKCDQSRGIDKPLSNDAAKPYRAVLNGKHIGYFDSEDAARFALNATRRGIILSSLGDYTTEIQRALMELSFVTNFTRLSDTL